MIDKRQGKTHRVRGREEKLKRDEKEEYPKEKEKRDLRTHD